MRDSRAFLGETSLEESHKTSRPSIPAVQTTPTPSFLVMVLLNTAKSGSLAVEIFFLSLKFERHGNETIIATPLCNAERTWHSEVYCVFESARTGLCKEMAILAHKMYVARYYTCMSGHWNYLHIIQNCVHIRDVQEM